VRATCSHGSPPTIGGPSVTPGDARLPQVVPLNETLQTLPRRVTQEEWTRRYDAAGLDLLGQVVDNRTRVLARCRSCGSEWESIPGSVHAGRGCERCGRARAGKQRRVGQAQRDAEAAAVGLRWLSPVDGAHVKTPCRCEDCGYEWEAWPSAVKRGSGCPRCAGNVATQADRIRQAAAVDATWLGDVGPSHQPHPIRCNSCGHEWRATPGNIAGGTRCPACAMERRRAKLRRTQEDWDEIAAAVNLEWLEDVTNAQTPTAARCLGCGHEWKAWPVNAWAGRGCTRCGQERGAAKQRRSQEDWERIAAASEIEILDEVVNALTPVQSRCLRCDLEWPVAPASLQQGRGCPACAQRGFDPSSPGVVYLLVKEDGTAKVGISGQGKRLKKRLADHSKNGYVLHRSWNLDDGIRARAVETLTVRRWRLEDQLPAAAPEGEDGYRETVSTSALPLKEIVRRIDELVSGPPEETSRK
jgi:predicted Zn-ribbon and HTH transcriptional regulator